MIARASRDLPSDTEVVFEYHGLTLTTIMAHTQKGLSSGDSNAIAGCVKHVRKQMNLHKEGLFGKMLWPHCKQGTLLKSTLALKEFEKAHTESSLDVPRIKLSVLQFLLAKGHLRQHSQGKAVESVLKAFSSLASW